MRAAATDSDSDSSVSYPSSSESDAEPAASSGRSETTTATPDFVAAQCLFCDVQSPDFDASMVHMASTHSFVVPHQASLVVDLPTLVWYLHLVIYAYHECVACGSRRRSAAAAQQHMQSKGHCHFDMANPEMRDFYDVTALDDARLVAALARPDDDGTLRLASGRIIAQRGGTQSNSGSSHRTRPERGRVDGTATTTGETTLVARGGEQQQVVLDDRKMATAAARQMAQLSARDQQALAHLAPHEQRAALTLRRKQADRVRRAEWRAQTALGRKGNKTLMKTYKAQGPERPLG